MSDPIRLTLRCQEFLGMRFYLCGNYFQRKGVRLHRLVWETAHGPIPKKHHVHHVDGDRANNALSNLVLMLGHDHMSHHNGTPERRAAARENVKKAIAVAPAWHRSEAGLAWHREHAKVSLTVAHKKLREATVHPHICYQCLKTFGAKLGSYFCTPACRTMAHGLGVKASWLKALNLKPLRLFTT